MSDPDDAPGLDTDMGGEEPLAGDFDLGGVEESNERGIRTGDPVTGDGTNRVGEPPEEAVDGDVRMAQAEPVRDDRGPGGGAPT